MKIARPEPPAERRRTAEILLSELREECEIAVRLIRRLETGCPRKGERQDILGDLSASVLHLHAHTDGLGELLFDPERQ